VRPTVVVLGANGQVARELGLLAPTLEFDLALHGRDSLDLSTLSDADEVVERLAPVGVINAAAYTAVDRAESEPDAADQLNHRVPAAFARACAARGLPFVHFSTDYVFDGSKTQPYVEDDPRNPLGVYGRTKAAGELAIEAAGGRWTTFRTSWVFSQFGANFVKTMLRLAQTRDELGVVADQLGRPTWAGDCASLAVEAVRRHLAGDAAAGGCFHLSSRDDATWAQFAEAIFAESAKRGGPTATVRPITTADYPTPAPRPANSRLNVSKLETAYAWRAPSWHQRLSSCMANLEW
jgi:dTDP-4-dehydrorhamnose reductase